MTPQPLAGIPVIGLVGGIGSGKSAVARGLVSRRNLVLIDADAIGHQVLKLPETKEKIKKRFGKDVFDSQGEIDRSRLAKKVFGTAEASQTAREDLNRIVHPLIGKQIHEEIQKAQEKARREPGSVSGVLLDAAILLETGWGDMCDAIVFVEASDEVREKRVRETRGWLPDDWKKREASQLSLNDKKHTADMTIHNSQNLELAIDELEQFFASQFSADQSSFRSDA